MAFSSSTTSTRPFIAFTHSALTTHHATPLSLRRQRQGDDEFGTASRFADDVDAAFMRLDDLLGDGHAEAGAPLFGGKERVEDPVDLVGGNATAVVAHAHGGAAPAGGWRTVVDEYLDAPAVGAVAATRQRVGGIVED